jgi:hypothetical protein
VRVSVELVRVYTSFWSLFGQTLSVNVQEEREKVRTGREKVKQKCDRALRFQLKLALLFCGPLSFCGKQSSPKLPPQKVYQSTSTSSFLRHLRSSPSSAYTPTDKHTLWSDRDWSSVFSFGVFFARLSCLNKSSRITGHFRWFFAIASDTHAYTLFLDSVYTSRCDTATGITRTINVDSTTITHTTTTVCYSLLVHLCVCARQNE